MKIVEERKLDNLFDLFWSEMENEFFKVEVLQYYGEDEGHSLKEWLAGNREKSLEILKTDAKSWAEGKENVKKIRIHIVDYPLSEYIRWEVEHYKIVNIPLVGEEVYLVDRKKINDIKLPRGDTMIFDKEKVVSNIYNKNGVVIRAEIYENPREVKPFLKLKDRLLKLPLERVG